VALERLNQMKAMLPQIGDVRGRGLLLGVELVKSRSSREPADDLAEATMYAALDAGLSFKTTMGNVLTLTPPLTITETEMLRALGILENAIRAAAGSR
jgi:4-aminobutyrate aminotransferase